MSWTASQLDVRFQISVIVKMLADLLLLVVAILLVSLLGILLTVLLVFLLVIHSLYLLSRVLFADLLVVAILLASLLGILIVDSFLKFDDGSSSSFACDTLCGSTSWSS